MTAAAPDYMPTRFPTRLLTDLSAFVLMVWAGAVATAFILVLGVSFWHDITASAWHIVGQPARWFLFALAVHIGWTEFELYVAHGRTRRAFMLETLQFLAVFAPLVSVLFALTFLIEAGYYGLMGWTQGIGADETFYRSVFEVPLVVLQWTLTFGLWMAGGLFVGAMWYRSAVLGVASLVIGIAFALISVAAIGEVAVSFGEQSNPISLVLHSLFFVARQASTSGIWSVVLLHVVMIGGMAGLAWLALRRVSIRSKSE